MLYLEEISVVGHGTETAQKLLRSTPHDRSLIQISISFAGLLLFVVGFLQWLFGGFTLKEGLRIWLGIAGKEVAGDFVLHFHGCSLLCIPGEKNTISPEKIRPKTGEKH
uniref:DUF7865 domain-containing protein n=1 Tax=Salix viminalis TaxID=40686 RepID=A0A6N2M093_SALVM